MAKRGYVATLTTIARCIIRSVTRPPERPGGTFMGHRSRGTTYEWHDFQTLPCGNNAAFIVNIFILDASLSLFD
eukprot:scaffold625047_cov17-Prasinocladus_malaysianus.AAC.1